MNSHRMPASKMRSMLRWLPVALTCAKIATAAAAAFDAEVAREGACRSARTRYRQDGCVPSRPTAEADAPRATAGAA